MEERLYVLMAAAVLGLGLSMCGVASGDDYCYRRGDATYCDKAGPTYRTSQGYYYTLQKDGGASVSTFGKSTYNNRDGSWRQKDKNGNVTGKYNHPYGTRDKVIDDWFGDD